MSIKVEPFMYQMPPPFTVDAHGFQVKAPTARQNFVEEWRTGTGPIYEVYKPVAVPGKYLGIVQLPSLYEKRKFGEPESQKMKTFMNQIFPVLGFIFQFFTIFNVIRLLIACYPEGIKKGVDYITIVFVNMQLMSLGPTTTLVFFFRSSKRMVNFLKAHSCIDDLLQQKKTKLCRFSKIGYSIAYVAIVLRSGCWMSMLRLHVIDFKVDLDTFYFPYTVNLAIFCFAVGLFLMATSEGQPQFTYILFQHVIKSCFDELIAQIKSNNRRPMEPKMAAAQVKKYRELHENLCDVCELLDALLSPIILHTYMVNSVTGIAAIFFLADQFSSSSPDWGCVFALFILSAVPMSFFALISMFADATTVAAAEVLPAVFSSLDLDSLEAKAEVELFALRVQCKKVAFSASGFFEINRGILTTIAGAMATYVIIMMQFKMSN